METNVDLFYQHLAFEGGGLLVYKGGDLARARGVVRLSYYNDTRKIANPSPDIRCYIFDQLFGCNTSSQPRKHETKRTSSQLLGIRYSHRLYCSVLHCKIFMDLITNTFLLRDLFLVKKKEKVVSNATPRFINLTLFGSF